MGLKMIVKDEVFRPADFGLSTGDVVDIVLVAGGNGQANGTSTGTLGQDSSFGSYAVAYAGRGSKGGGSGYTGVSATNSGTGGGGGFVPGSPFQGGNGYNASVASAVTPPIVITNSNGGGGASTNFKIFGGNGACFGGGSYGSYAEGGAGYGAGGGSPGSSGYYAGDGGQILYASRVLSQSDITNGIPVTIGQGGPTVESTDPTVSPCYAYGENGTYNSFSAVSNFSKVIGEQLYSGTGHIQTSLVDGSQIISKGNAFTQNPTHVKIYGRAALDSLDTAFPGNFGNTAALPFYYCNGYYVQCQNTSAGCNVRAWPADKVRAGTVVLADRLSVTYGTGFTPVGFNDTDMIMFVSSTSIRRYANWTPALSTYTSVTLTNPVTFLNYDQNNLFGATSFYVPMGTTSFAAINFAYDSSGASTNGSSNGNSRYYISNYTTGATTATSYMSQTIVGYLAMSGYANTLQNSSGTLYRIVGLMTSFSVNVSTTQAYRFGAGTNNYLMDQGTYNGAQHSASGWICIGTTGYAFQPGITSNYIATAVKVVGYNNVAGVNGSGAGGCCMITW